MSFNLSCFEQGPFPASQAVVPPGHEGDGWECDEAVRFYAGKSVGDVTYASLRDQYRKDWTTAHHLLTDAAFLHFLPALMKISTNEDLYASTPVGLLADDIVHSLLRMARGEMDHRLLPMLRSYSKLQLREVAGFLVFMSSAHHKEMGDQNPAEMALRLFWRMHLDPAS